MAEAGMNATQGIRQEQRLSLSPKVLLGMRCRATGSANGKAEQIEIRENKTETSTKIGIVAQRFPRR